MKKVSHKPVKFSAEQMAYELPADIDVRTLKPVGTGVDTIRKLAERSKHMVGLDPEVAKVFKDSDSVNNVLRAIIGNLPQAEKKRRKSA